LTYRESCGRWTRIEPERFEIGSEVRQQIAPSFVASPDVTSSNGDTRICGDDRRSPARRRTSHAVCLNVRALVFERCTLIEEPFAIAPLDGNRIGCGQCSRCSR
jgi:hypothetical protein